MTPENQRDEDLKKAEQVLLDFQNATKSWFRGESLDMDKRRETMIQILSTAFSEQRQSWEREKELDSHILAIDDANTRAQDEITRLKSRNEELVAENERLRDFSKSYDVTENSVYQEAKKEISRLTSALGAAHEALKKLDSYGHGWIRCGAMGSPVFTCGSAVTDTTGPVLADPTGQLAFEKWKKMEAVVEVAREFHKTNKWSDAEALRKSLEALDAKGGA